MSHWRVGDVSITRVIEVENAFRGTWLLPDATPEAVREVDWLRPLFAEEQGKLRMSAHSLAVRSGGLTILVDTGIGNDKDRPDVPGWHQRRGSFLADMAAAGFPRESIDRVVCTHLHADHVGWNTMLDDGRWVPTFPNARYLFVRSEYEHWLANVSVQGGLFADSVRPVVDAGLVEWTDPDARITDQVFLQPSFGHTPGHVCVRVSDGGEEAVVTGDLMHHPVQCARPDWATTFDVDADTARAVRQEFLQRHAGTSTLVFGTHFATPGAGHIVRDGAAWRFDAQ